MASSQVMSGSERNHVRWRLENAKIALGVEVDRGVAGQLPVEDRPGLAVADRGKGRQAWVEPFAQGARLLDQTRVELGAGAGRDAGGVDMRLESQAEPRDRAGVAVERRRRAVATELGDLERTNHPPRVSGVDAGRQRRGKVFESRDRRRQPVGDERRLESGADVGIAGQGVGVEAAPDGAQVEARASREDRQPTVACRCR